MCIKNYKEREREGERKKERKKERERDRQTDRQREEKKDTIVILQYIESGHVQKLSKKLDKIGICLKITNPSTFKGLCWVISSQGWQEERMVWMPPCPHSIRCLFAYVVSTLSMWRRNEEMRMIDR